VDCTTTLAEKNRYTSQEIISITFVGIYGGFSFLLSALLLIFGSFILRTLLQMPMSKFRAKHVKNTSLVMGCCFIFLTLQTIYLITRSLKDLQWGIISTLTFLYFADIIPVVFFVLSFRRAVGTKDSTSRKSASTKMNTISRRPNTLDSRDIDM